MLGATGCGPHLGANIFKRRNKARPINLALQGGGVHGAFTWGVLERLLADDTLSFGWISGTSAGAINAVAVAHGLAHGGKEAAVSALENLWHAVIAAQVPDFIKLNPFMAGLVRAAGVSHSQMGAMFSPYEFNPARVDPLRTLLEQQIDFEAIRAKQPCELIIAATDIATGRARLFGTADLTVDAVLASACLPMLHHAVTIDGRSYWDGGFLGEPGPFDDCHAKPSFRHSIGSTEPDGTPGERPDRSQTSQTALKRLHSTSRCCATWKPLFRLSKRMGRPRGQRQSVPLQPSSESIAFMSLKQDATLRT